MCKTPNVLILQAIIFLRGAASLRLIIILPFLIQLFVKILDVKINYLCPVLEHCKYQKQENQVDSHHSKEGNQATQSLNFKTDWVQAVWIIIFDLIKVLIALIFAD